jgi:hypothetical protein
MISKKQQQKSEDEYFDRQEEYELKPANYYFKHSRFYDEDDEMDND